jgi:hypothetical protein
MLAFALGVEATLRRFRVLFIGATDLCREPLEAGDERRSTALQQRAPNIRTDYSCNSV